MWIQASVYGGCVFLKKCQKFQENADVIFVTAVSEISGWNQTHKIRVCFSFMGDDVLFTSVPNFLIAL